jgi:hypothetical protein
MGFEADLEVCGTTELRNLGNWISAFFIHGYFQSLCCLLFQSDF